MHFNQYSLRIVPCFVPKSVSWNHNPLEKTEGATKNGQSRDTGNTIHKDKQNKKKKKETTQRI